MYTKLHCKVLMLIVMAWIQLLSLEVYFAAISGRNNFFMLLFDP